MSDIERGITVNVATHGAKEATATITRLAAAIERAKKALDNLNGAQHGGITIKIVGELAHVEIAPPEGLA